MAADDLDDELDQLSPTKVRELLADIAVPELRDGLLYIAASNSAAKAFTDTLREVVEEQARKVGDTAFLNRVELESPDGLGKVVWTRVADGPGITDEEAFGRWVVANYPTEAIVRIRLHDPRDLDTPDGMNGDESVELRLAGGYKHEQVDFRPIPHTVEIEVRGKWRQKFLDQVDLKDDAVIDRGTGEVVAGMGNVPRSGGLRVYPAADTKDRAVYAFRRMALREALRQLPAPLPEAEAAVAAEQARDLLEADPLAGVGSGDVVPEFVDVEVLPENVVSINAKREVAVYCANCSVPAHHAAQRPAAKATHAGKTFSGGCTLTGCSCKRYKAAK